MCVSPTHLGRKTRCAFSVHLSGFGAVQACQSFQLRLRLQFHSKTSIPKVINAALFNREQNELAFLNVNRSCPLHKIKQL